MPDGRFARAMARQEFCQKLSLLNITGKRAAARKPAKKIERAIGVFSNRPSFDKKTQLSSASLPIGSAFVK
jgi:hypothetical protein